MYTVITTSVLNKNPTPKPTYKLIVIQTITTITPCKRQQVHCYTDYKRILTIHQCDLIPRSRGPVPVERQGAGRLSPPVSTKQHPEESPRHPPAHWWEPWRCASQRTHPGSSSEYLHAGCGLAPGGQGSTSELNYTSLSQAGHSKHGIICLGGSVEGGNCPPQFG